MLKAYRKRFIVLNMCLIGIALLSVLIAVTVYTYYDYTAELKKTMMQVLEPINTLPPDVIEEGTAPKDMSGTEREGNGATGKTVEGSKGKKPDDDDIDVKNGLRNKPKIDKKIITVRYYEKTDDYSIRSYDLNISKDKIKSASQLAASQEKEFGRLPGYNLFYYKTTVRDGYSVALTHITYFHSSMVKLVSILVLIFVSAMILFYVLSYNLSKVAAKPLEKTMTLEKQFVADISHQLKTPLTVILANNSIIKENPDSSVSEQMSWVENTDAAARRMMDLIENMLTLSAVEFAGHKVKEEKCDFSSIVTKATLQMESVAFEKGIIPETDIEDGIYVYANKEYLNTICRGLIDNALKYEANGGSISISLHCKKKNAQMCVHNRGSFIQKEDIPHIFERFYRSSQTKNEQNGYGLGLAIVKEMTEKSKGSISVHSSKENGTLFTVIIPISQ